MTLSDRVRSTLIPNNLMPDDVLDEADQVSLQRVDEAKAVLRPSEIAEFYVEVEYDARGEAQPKLFRAEGEGQARPYAAQADGLKERADDQTFAVDLQKDLTTDSKDRFKQFRSTLRTYTRRAPKEKFMYYFRMLLILLGDITGISGAAIMLGEIPALAIVQAISVGAAGVTSGLLATEIKDARLARKRQKDEDKLTPEEQAFAHLFRGPDDGEVIAKAMVFGGLFLVTLIFGGVMALRSTTEGMVAGIVFGCMAAAVALASWANCYHYADEVADLLDNMKVDFRDDVKYLDKLSAGKSRQTHASSTTTAKSIRDEYEQRGQAAKYQYEAGKNRALRGSPGIAGHGRPTRSIASPASVDPEIEELERQLHDDTAEDADIVVLGTNKSNGNGSKPEAL